MNYRQFVRLLASSSEESVGATIVAYRPRDAQLAIIPWVDGELLDGDNERLDEFPGLAGWWRE